MKPTCQVSCKSACREQDIRDRGNVLNLKEEQPAPKKLKNMEVHHHPDLHHKKKNFKEYFLEFLMIFLAVSMGFIAENTREYFSDNAKEKEYINSFIRNLQDDSTHLTNTISENLGKLEKLNRLMSLSSKNISDTLNRKLLYRYTAQSIGFYSEFKSNDATMLQLTNSGGLRFIRKGHIADSIAKYDIEMKAIYAAENLYTNATNLGILATHELFDYTIFLTPLILKMANLPIDFCLFFRMIITN